MNHRITPTSIFSALIPTFSALVTARGAPPCTSFELQDTVLRAGGYAWDIGNEAAALHTQIEQILADKQIAEDLLASAPPTKAFLRSSIADRRWQEEGKGCLVNFGEGRSLLVATDVNSQAKLTGLLVIASTQPVTVKWKGADGSFLTITNSDVLVMAGTVFSYVQACFAREAVLLEQLELTEDTASFVPVIEAFWG